MTPADFIVATNVAMRIEHMLKEVSMLADSFGSMVTVQQILTGVLTYGFEMTERPLSREEYLSVYEYVMASHAAPEEAGTPEPGPASGPGDTADAATSEEADRLADHWGKRISDAAFSFEVPDLGGQDG
jgi:hypothetical protein